MNVLTPAYILNNIYNHIFFNEIELKQFIFFKLALIEPDQLNHIIIQLKLKDTNKNKKKIFTRKTKKK